MTDKWLTIENRINQKGDGMQRIRQLLADGRKIEAIKIAVKEGGVGLRDAKHFVEQLAP